MIISIKECQKKGLDANSLLIMSIIESRNLDDWNWLLTLIVPTRMVKYVEYLIKRGFIENINLQGFWRFDDLRLVKKKKSKKVLDESEFGKFVEDYYQLWPKGITSGGYAVKSGKDACASKLRTFMKKNPLYTQQIILQATSNYIQRCKGNDYQFMKLANYFISKDGISVLENCCEEIVNGTFKQPSKINIELG